MIISGYKHFEYAKSALNYGVEDYLVKPINKSELNKILIRIRDRKLESNGKLENEKLLRLQLEINRMKLRKQFIDILLFEPERFEDQSLELINSE